MVRSRPQESLYRRLSSNTDHWCTIIFKKSGESHHSFRLKTNTRGFLCLSFFCSLVDFAYIKEMASRREKVRTRKPFLSEMRSHHHSGRSAPSSGERSTSRVSRESACTRENLRTKNNLRLKAKSSNSRSMTNCEIKQNRPSASWMICEIK